MEPRDRRAEESRAALARVERDTQSLAGSPLQRLGRRVGDHLSAADAIGAGEGGDTDPIEIWGRRIGRLLSVALALALTWWLGAQLGWL